MCVSKLRYHLSMTYNAKKTVSGQPQVGYLNTKKPKNTVWFESLPKISRQKTNKQKTLLTVLHASRFRDINVRSWRKEN